MNNNKNAVYYSTELYDYVIKHGKNDHKYIKKEMVNGKMRYYYDTDTRGSKQNTVARYESPDAYKQRGNDAGVKRYSPSVKKREYSPSFTGPTKPGEIVDRRSNLEKIKDKAAAGLDTLRANVNELNRNIGDKIEEKRKSDAGIGKNDKPSATEAQALSRTPKNTNSINKDDTAKKSTAKETDTDVMDKLVERGKSFIEDIIENASAFNTKVKKAVTNAKKELNSDSYSSTNITGPGRGNGVTTIRNKNSGKEYKVNDKNADNVLSNLKRDYEDGRLTKSEYEQQVKAIENIHSDRKKRK